PALPLSGRQGGPAGEFGPIELEQRAPAGELSVVLVDDRRRLLHVLRTEHDAHVGRQPTHAPRVRYEITGEQAQEGRLARAVLSHEAVPARGEVQSNVFEEGQCPGVRKAKIDNATGRHEEAPGVERDVPRGAPQPSDIAPPAGPKGGFQMGRADAGSTALAGRRSAAQESRAIPGHRIPGNEGVSRKSARPTGATSSLSVSSGNGPAGESVLEPHRRRRGAAFKRMTQKAQACKTPSVRCDLHMHSTCSDGSLSVG